MAKETVNVEAEKLTIKVGNLEIVSSGPSGMYATVKLDGVAKPVTRIVVTIDVNDTPRVEMTWLPEFEFKPGSRLLQPVQTPTVADAFNGGWKHPAMEDDKPKPRGREFI